MSKKVCAQFFIIGSVCLLFIFLVAVGSPPAFGGEETPEISYLPFILQPAGTPTATSTPTNTPMPTTIPPGAVPDVDIIFIEYDPAVGTDADGEFVRIQNNELGPVDMTNWQLSDIANNTYTFPAFVLPAGAVVRVWVRGGTNTATELYWSRGSAVWNNGGDTAFLRNINNDLVDSCAYSGGGNNASCN